MHDQEATMKQRHSSVLVGNGASGGRAGSLDEAAERGTSFPPGVLHPHPSFPHESEWRQIGARLSWSPKETRIVRDLILGLPRKQVASLHRITKSTLQTHLDRVLSKAASDGVIALLWKVMDLRDEMRRSRGEASPRPHRLSTRG
jgi:DNA-binding NarL/FixJ family response regulator